MPRTRIAAAATALVVLAGFAGTSAAQAKPHITMSGSTSIFPLAVKLASAYLKDRGKIASFTVNPGSSDIGIADVSRGRVSIGNSSRDPKPGDPKGIVFNKIARDALCLITNRENPLPNISQDQVQAIFSGRVRNWNDVPGAQVSGPIKLFVRTAASGTQDAFQQIFMGPNLSVTPSAAKEKSNGLQAAKVRADPQAIGYASFNFIKGAHAIPYKGVSCSLRNAKSGQYGGVRNFWMVTRGKARGPVAKFIKWTRKSKAARNVVATNWVPLR
jgi:phosphate transport system substrate-binding protein